MFVFSVFVLRIERMHFKTFNCITGFTGFLPFGIDSENGIIRCFLCSRKPRTPNRLEYAFENYGAGSSLRRMEGIAQ